MHDLREINLSFNQITNMGSFRCPSLRSINLFRNKVPFIAGLKNLKRLEYLNLSGNELENLNGIEFLGEMKYFIANDNSIHTLNHLKNFPNLSDLQVSNNPITNIPHDALDANTKLISLSMEGVQVGSFAFLLKLASLQDLYISENREIKNLHTFP